MTTPRVPFLERLGLHRPELRAWALYDWANSAFVLIVMTAVFPVYYRNVAASGIDGTRAEFWYAAVTSGALALVAILAPIFGALGDYLGRRKQLLAVFMGIGVLATAALALVGSGDWRLALALFAIGNIGVATSFVFYDALLPHIASGNELDRVSTAGYALGYLGSGLLLVVDLLAITKPELFGLPDRATATRLSFLTVAVWWVLFAIPLFRRVPEPPREVEADELAAEVKPSLFATIRVTFSRLAETFRELRTSYREAFKLLVAVLIYNDGIGTIIRMASLYAASRNLPELHIIAAILLVQFVGIPFAFLFGHLAGRIGPKRSILIALVVYTGISILAYRMTTVQEFYVLAILVGMVQGGAQALSRSLFASMIPKHKASEFFGFFAVFEKFAGIIGPAVFTLMIGVTGSSQKAILSVIAFFVVGGGLLGLVDVEAGRRLAREADARLLRDPDAGHRVDPNAG